MRALRREFALDDEAAEDLADELVEAQQVATRDGNVLVWSGAPTAAPAAPPSAPAPGPGPSAGGERRQLTVMFCDLVGSTALSQQLDPEELRELLREYRSVCVDATKRYGGHVAQYLGDGVMVYFGYPQAHEDAAGRAIRAALEIQRVLASRPEASRISARIGIHTGLVVVDAVGGGDEALALGPTSNLAARVQGVAEPGRVAVSDATLALCRGVFVTRSLGEVELKGIEEPVLLHEVETMAGVRTATDRGHSDKPMVGRDLEVRMLLDRWEEVQAGRGHVLLVSGEPGMGKTRLLEALRAELAGASHLWLDMQCSPFTAGSAFQPVVDLFNTGLTFGSADTPEEAARLLETGMEALPGLPAEAVVPYLLPLLSLPASERYPLPQTSADQQRERTLAALVQVNHTLAERQPLVLVVEDLHWADPSTLEYLTRVVEQSPTARLLLVVTFRPEFHPPWAQSHVSEVKLARLSQRVTRELITNAVGGKLPEPVLAALETRSDGVPLFIEELTSGVVSSGVMTEQSGRFELHGSMKDLAIPATLQDSLMARLDRLSASKHIAQQGATLGREFSYELIEAVTDLDTPALRIALDQLVTAEILYRRGVAPDATYTFKHALLQDTAYESQLLSTRKQLHKKIAEVLEERFPKRVEAEPEVIARHCAAAGEHSKAVDHYQRSAELAMSRLSNHEASELFALALEGLAALPDDPGRQQREIAIRIATASALAALHGFDAAAVRDHHARVEELCTAVGEGPQQLPALIGLMQAESNRGSMLDASKYANSILGLAEPLGVRELMVVGQVVTAAALITNGSQLEASQRLTDALAIAAELDFPPPATPYDLDLVAMAYFSHANALASVGKPEQALEALRLGNVRANEIDHDLTRAQVAGGAAITGFLMDDPEYSLEVGREGLAHCAGRGFHSQELMATMPYGWACVVLGDADEGIRQVERGIELANASGSVAGLPAVLVVASHVFRLVKQYERSEAFIDQAAELYTQSGELAYHYLAAFARGQLVLEWGDGDVERAEALFLEAAEVSAQYDVLQCQLMASTELARLAPRTGKLQEAHDRLAATYAKLSEGLECGPAVAARNALAELATALGN